MPENWGDDSWNPSEDEDEEAAAARRKAEADWGATIATAEPTSVAQAQATPSPWNRDQDEAEFVAGIGELRPEIRALQNRQVPRADQPRDELGQTEREWQQAMASQWQPTVIGGQVHVRPAGESPFANAQPLSPTTRDFSVLGVEPPEPSDYDSPEQLAAAEQQWRAQLAHRTRAGWTADDINDEQYGAAMRASAAQAQGAPALVRGAFQAPRQDPIEASYEANLRAERAFREADVSPLQMRAMGGYTPADEYEARRAAWNTTAGALYQPPALLDAQGRPTAQPSPLIDAQGRPIEGVPRADPAELAAQNELAMAQRAIYRGPYEGLFGRYQDPSVVKAGMGPGDIASPLGRLVDRPEIVAKMIARGVDAGNTEGLSAIAAADPTYVSLLREHGPDIAYDYFRQRYPGEGLRTAIAEMLTNPLNILGTEAIPGVVRGLGMAATKLPNARVGTAIAGGLERVAQGADVLENVVNAPATALRAALGPRGAGALPGLRQSRQSAASEAVARERDLVAQAERNAGFDLTDPTAPRPAPEAPVTTPAGPPGPASVTTPAGPVPRAGSVTPEGAPANILDVPPEAQPSHIAAQLHNALTERVNAGRVSPEAADAAYAAGVEDLQRTGAELQAQLDEAWDLTFRARAGEPISQQQLTETWDAYHQAVASKWGAHIDNIRGMQAEAPPAQPSGLVDAQGRPLSMTAGEVDAITSRPSTAPAFRHANAPEAREARGFGQEPPRAAGPGTAEAIDDAQQASMTRTGLPSQTPRGAGGRDEFSITQDVNAPPAPVGEPVGPGQWPGPLNRPETVSEARALAQAGEVPLTVAGIPVTNRRIARQLGAEKEWDAIHNPSYGLAPEEAARQTLAETRRLGSQPALNAPDLRGVRVGEGEFLGGHPANAVERRAQFSPQGPPGTTASAPVAESAPVDAATQHLDELRNSQAYGLMTPGQQAAMEKAVVVVRPAQAQAEQDLAKMTQLREAGEFLPAKKILESYGLSRWEDFDPGLLARAKYWEQFAKSVGYAPDVPLSKGAWAAVEFFNREWRPGALISIPYHINNVANQFGNSALQGVLPFSGTVGRTLGQYGLATLTNLEKWTMGQGGFHDFNAKIIERLGPQGFADELRRIAGGAGRAWTSGHPLEATWGSTKELQFAVAGFFETNARAAMFTTGLDRYMKAAILRAVRDGRKELGPGVAKGIAGLDDFTGTNVAQYLRTQGVSPEVAARWGQRFNTELERGYERGFKLVERVHFNYGDRSTIEMNSLFRETFAFSKWALSNSKFYAEAALSRPAMWNAINQLGRAREALDEIEPNLPPRLRNAIQITGGLAPALAGAAFGDPRAKIFANPVTRAFTAPGQQPAFVGTGAHPVGEALATAGSYVGMSLSPLIDIPLKATGLFGDLPVSFPWSPHTVPGALAQGAYSFGTGQLGRAGAGGPTTGNLGFDWSRAARTVGGTNERFNDPDRVQAGGGPIMDSYIRERIRVNALRDGLDPNTDPAVIRAPTDFGSPLYQRAYREVLHEQSNPAMATARSSLGLKGISEEKYASAQGVDKFQADLARGVPFGEALKANPGADDFWRMNKPRPWNEEQATYREQGLRFPRGASVPSEVAYPGRGASQADLGSFFQAQNKADLATAANLRANREGAPMSQAAPPATPTAPAGGAPTTPSATGGAVPTTPAELGALQRRIANHAFSLRPDERRVQGDAVWKVALSGTKNAATGETRPVASAEEIVAAGQALGFVGGGAAGPTAAPSPTEAAPALEPSSVEFAQALPLPAPPGVPLTPAQLQQGVAKALFGMTPQQQRALSQTAWAVALSGTINKQTGERRPIATEDQIRAAADELGVGGQPATGSPPPPAGGVARVAAGGPSTAGAARATGTAVAGGTQAGPAPFSGRTVQQQLGTAFAHATRLRDTEGEPAANKFVYDNYDRFKALKDQLGETMASRGSYGRRALTGTERPESFAGSNLQQSYARMARMRDTLNDAIKALSEDRLDRAHFLNRWKADFGETLKPEEVTVEQLVNKLDWVIAQTQQARRYERTPAGAKELTERDSARNAFTQAKDVLAAANEARNVIRQRLASYSDRYRELGGQGNRDAGRYWGSTEAQRKADQAAYRQADEEYKRLKARADEAYQRAYGQAA